MAIDDNFERDAVEGLIEYVEEIKPFHCKIAEVLVEYIYTDEISVTISDNMNSVLDIAVNGFTLGCSDAYDTGGYDFFAGNVPITDSIENINLTNNSIIFDNVDLTSRYPSSKEVEILESTDNDGNYTVLSSAFNGTETEVFLSPSLTSGTLDGVITSYIDDTLNLPLSNYDTSSDPSCDIEALGSPQGGKMATTFTEDLNIEVIAIDLLGGEFDVDLFDDLTGDGFDL